MRIWRYRMNRRIKYVIAIAGLFALSPHSRSRVDEPIPLPTGKLITPVGTHTPIGSFPVNMLLSPNGKYVVVTNSGYRQFLSVLNAEDGKVVSQIQVGGGRDKSGLFYGLTFGPSEGGAAQLYASRGTEEKVAIYSLSADGILTDTGKTLDAPTGIKESKNDVAGIAMSGNLLFAANNHTSPFTDMKGVLNILPIMGDGPMKKVVLPGFPFAVAAVEREGKSPKVYVTSERDSVVSIVDPGTASISRTVSVGDQPIGLLLNKKKDRLYVANAGSDTISVIDTNGDTVVGTILLRPDDSRGLPGATPTGMALSPDEQRLYVTLADMNALAVVDLPKGKLVGYVPTGWYPTAVVATGDGRRLYIANAKGVQARNPNDKPVKSWGRYIENIIEGTVAMLPVPGETELRNLTAKVFENNFTNREFNRDEANQISNLKSKIQHVIYIIKENRTYDQVFGDLPQGNGDKSLCLFPREVTPNQHALAERFVLLDNFYCAAEVSADGWEWSTEGMASEYAARNTPYNYSGRGKMYDEEGQNNQAPVDIMGIPDVARAPGGYIWDAVAKKGLSYRNYGFFLNSTDEGNEGPGGRPIAVYNAPNKRVLVGHTDEDFLQFDMTYADSDAWRTADAACPKQMKSYGKNNSPSRFAEWKREFDQFVKNGKLPRFTMLRLPRDHTSGTSVGLHTPRAMVADNDYAVGQVVEAISNSPYWDKTAIFILEDDAQNGYDHVDAHRSPALVISPYVRKSVVDHRFYNTDSMLRTMELIMGLPPMCQYDAVAAPISVFAERPENNEPYKAILPDRTILAEVNKATAYRARESARLNFRHADAVPDGVLTDIVWHSVKGAASPPKTVAFRHVSPGH